MQSFRSSCRHHRAKLHKLLPPSSCKASQTTAAVIVQILPSSCCYPAKLQKLLLPSSCEASEAVAVIFVQSFRSYCCHLRAKLQKLLLPSSCKAAQAVAAIIVQSFRSCCCHHRAKLHKLLLPPSCKAPQAVTATIVQSFRNCCWHHREYFPNCRSKSKTVLCVSAVVFQKLTAHSMSQFCGGLTSLLLHTNKTDTTDHICLNKHSETFVEGLELAVVCV